METAPTPRRASGNGRTLVGIDSPDDVDLYRHDSPPPGFGGAKLTRQGKSHADDPGKEDNLTER